MDGRAHRNRELLKIREIKGSAFFVLRGLHDSPRVGVAIGWEKCFVGI